MTDLNTLIPPDSALQLISGEGINDRGEIAGTAFDPSTGEAPAFLAVAHCGPAAAEPATDPIPKVTLPENIRVLLQRRMRFGRLGG